MTMCLQFNLLLSNFPGRDIDFYTLKYKKEPVNCSILFYFYNFMVKQQCSAINIFFYFKNTLILNKSFIDKTDVFIFKTK